MALKDDFLVYLESHGISQSQAAKALGYSPAVITAYKQGTYAGRVDKLEADIASWLERELTRSTILDIPILETTLLKQVSSACDIAYEEKDIAVIVGYAGCGKSVALRDYVRRHQDRVYYLEANKATSLHVLIMRLGEMLGLSLKGNAADVTARIGAFLKGRDTLLIVDQADDLPDSALEYLRQIIFDEGQTGLVLVGLTKLAGQIMNARNDHDQLLSRVGLYVRLPALEVEDISRVIRNVWPSLNNEVEKTFVEKSTLRMRAENRPSLRRLTKIMKRANRIMYKNKLDLPTTEIVEHAARFIMNQEL
jgi:DNA transposition AAA+ family ATPase